MGTPIALFGLGGNAPRGNTASLPSGAEFTAPIGAASDVDELLGQLKGFESPEPPPKVGVGRRILGALGDALGAAAAVKAGGVPPVRGPFASELLRQKEEFRIASAEFEEQQAELNNKILNFKIQRAVAAEERTHRELDDIAKGKRTDILLRERREEADRRTATRQKEDDERDAAIALTKWKRDKVFELAREAAEAGLSEDIIPKGDPNLLRPQDIVDLGLQIRSGIAGKPVTPAQRIQAQEEAAKEANPGLELSTVTFSGEDGRPNARFAISPLSRLTNADRTLAINAGINPFTPEGIPRSTAEVMAEVAELKKVEVETKQKARTARLAVLVKGSKLPKGTIGMKLAEHLTMLQNAEVIKVVLSGRGGDPGGPLSGRFPPGLRYAVVELFHGAKAADRNREVTQRIQNIFNVLAKIRSGAAVTLPEEIRLQPELAIITDTRTTMLSKINLLIEFEKRFIENLRKTSGLQPADLDFVGESLSTSVFIPIEPEAGDILIFGGEQ